MPFSFFSRYRLPASLLTRYAPSDFVKAGCLDLPTLRQRGADELLLGRPAVYRPSPWFDTVNWSDYAAVERLPSDTLYWHALKSLATALPLQDVCIDVLIDRYLDRRDVALSNKLVSLLKRNPAFFHSPKGVAFVLAYLQERLSQVTGATESIPYRTTCLAETQDAEIVLYEDLLQLTKKIFLSLKRDWRLKPLIAALIRHCKVFFYIEQAVKHLNPSLQPYVFYLSMHDAELFEVYKTKLRLSAIPVQELSLFLEAYVRQPYRYPRERIRELIAVIATVSAGPFLVFDQGRRVTRLVNAAGEIYGHIDCLLLWDFYEGRAAVRNRQERWGFIDTSGQEVVPFVYDWVGSFRQGLAPVCLHGKWGLLNRDAQLVVEPTYHSFEALYQAQGDLDFLNDIRSRELLFYKLLKG